MNEANSIAQLDFPAKIDWVREYDYEVLVNVRSTRSVRVPEQPPTRRNACNERASSARRMCLCVSGSRYCGVAKKGVHNESRFVVRSKTNEES